MNLNFSVYINVNESTDFIDERIHKIYPKMSQEWIDSNKVFKCEDCSSIFGFFNRKHHCRACGHVYCGNCCSKYIKIPTDLIDIPKEKNGWSNYIKSIVYNNNSSLVCNDCYQKIYILNDIKHIIYICNFLTLPELYNAILLDKKWYTAAIHCLSKFRNIQYKNTLSKSDYNILLANIRYFSGHSVWTNMLLKSYITLDKKNIDYNFNDRIDCWNLMCSRKCKNYIDIIDIIDIIYHYNKDSLSSLECRQDSNKDNNIEIVTLIYDLIQQNIKNNDCDNIYYIIIPYLITSLKLSKINGDNEVFIYNILSIFGNYLTNIKTFIFLLLCEYNYLFTNFYDTHSTSTINNSTIPRLLNVINIYLNKNVRDATKNYTSLVNCTINFFTNMYSSYSSKKSNLKYENLSIIYPFDTDYLITDICDIKELNSSSKPLLLTIKISNINTPLEKIEKKIILKFDKGLRKENIVSQIIIILQKKLVDQMKRGRIESFEEIPTYRIIMLSNELGIIEYLDNCYTLKSITQKNYTLQNYILENNKDEKIGNVKERFAKSLAISSCFSYILGLGDRHAGNIMISKNGQIIHIDYGYILENPIHSSLITPIIRISNEMIDFLGGWNSDYFIVFKNYIIKVFDIVRLYSDIIKNYYQILAHENIISWDSFKVKLEERFLNGINNKGIEILLIDIIQTSSNGYGGTFIDICNEYGSKIKSIII